MSGQAVKKRSNGRRVIAALLVVVNLVLAGALIVSTVSGTGAYAQAGLGTDFLTVTAKAEGRSSDVLYILDLTTHQLHAFYLGVQPNGQIQRAESRNLRKDFNTQ